jgi:hypothetical protein
MQGRATLRPAGAGIRSWEGAVALTLTAFALAGGVACSTVTNAAAKDPMQCERNPACSRGRASYADCTRQCVDDPECIARCDQVQKQNDQLGH